METYEEILKKLETEKGPDAVGITGDPIIIERIKRREEIDVLRLLKKGADLNVKSLEKETLLQLAIEYNMVSLSKKLLALGFDPDITHAVYHPTPLFLAARSCNIKLVNLLLDYGALVDEPSYASETPLMCSSESGCLEVVKKLLDSGASVNKSSKSGWSPLIHAGMGGHVSIAETLLMAGASPDVKDNNGNTATDWARKKHDGMVAQGFRNLGIIDHYVLDASLKLNWKREYSTG